jgi:hypothetical protein
MKNKNLIIGGVILAGIVAYYFYNKNKGGVNMPSSTVGSAPMSSPIEPAKVSSNMPSPIRKGGSPAVARDLTEQEKQKIRNDLFNGKPKHGDCSKGGPC